MFIKTVLYVSKAQHLRALTQLRALLPLARAANQRHDITGVLKFDGLNYMQVLEGPSKNIDAVMARIAMDKRHSKLRVLFDERRADRSYQGFPMSYLFDEAHRGLTTELVEGTRVLSGIQVRDMLLGSPGTVSPVG